MSETRSKNCVLVVEDNEDVRKVVVTYLRSRNYDVHEAVDGEQGISQARRLKPDIILLDVLLPKKDGLEVLSELRQEPETRDLPVVLMSAVLQTDDIDAEMSRLHVAAFLPKPFQVRSLLATIEKVLVSSGGSERPSPSALRRRSKITVRQTGFPDSGTETTQGESNDDKKNRVICRFETLPGRGLLEQHPMPRIVQTLFCENRTGRLRLVSNAIEKRIYFQNGYPVYAESSVPSETLGAFLVNRKRITREQHDAVMTEMGFSGAQYGEILLKFGYLNPHEMMSQLEEHLMEKVVQTFAWTTGQFLFEEGDGWKDSVIISRMRPGRVILDGIEQHWTTEQVRAVNAWRGAEYGFCLNDSPFQSHDLLLTTGEAKLLQQVCQHHPISRIVHGSSNKDGALKTLFSFYLMRLIGFSSKPPVQREPLRESMMTEFLSRPREAMVDESDERVQAFLSDYVKYRTSDFFTLLGVTPSSSDAEIQRAYEQKKQQYHPDRLMGIQNSAVHDRVEELGLRVYNAYRTLSQPDERARYLSTLDGVDHARSMLSPRSRTSRYSALPLSQSVPSKDFEKGVNALREGKYGDALELFQTAESADSRIKHQAYIEWTGYLNDPEKGDESLSRLLELQKKAPDEALIPYLIGSLYVRRKRTKDALAYLEKALSIDPQHIDAARQIRILKMRKTTESSGLFDILTKKR